MSQKSARFTANEIFRQETLSFEKIPGQSKLFIDFQSNSENVARFYPEKNTPLSNFAEKVLSEYEVDRAALCEILAADNRRFGAGRKTFQNIERLRETDCLAIVTGQQAGLFSGALYTIYKILSAVKFADNLRGKNIKAVPVFWIAEEDHDFDEVKKTFNLNRNGKLFKSENTPDGYRKNYPVGLVKLDETIGNEIERLFEQLPQTEFTDETKKMLAETYRPDKNYSQAFAELIAKIFAEHGVIIVSPMSRDLKKLCAPIFVRSIERAVAINAALLERDDELKAEKYQPQVLVGKDFFPFFFQSEDGQRQSLRRNLENRTVKVQQSRREFEPPELLEIAENSPHNLSPNALMRPVVQDYLLPTLVYFGGAAEITYFAQNSVVYKILNRPVTPIRHRASFSVVERKHARYLEKYRLNFVDLFGGKEKVWSQIVEKYLGRETTQTFAAIEAEINLQLDLLDELLLKDEPTLAANLANRRKKILWHLTALQKKYHRAAQEKHDAAYQKTENTFAALLPHAALQERTLNVVAFLNLYGENFIEWIYEAVEVDEKEHQILYF